MVKEPFQTLALTPKAWIEDLLCGNPRRFRNNMRMQTETFTFILHQLEQKGSLQPSRYVSTKENLAMFFYIVEHAASNRLTQERFQRSILTITASFNDVLEAMMRI